MRHSDADYKPRRVRHADFGEQHSCIVEKTQLGVEAPSEPSKNWTLLSSFVLFCSQHPDLRFWQALSQWSRMFIYAGSYNTRERALDTALWTTRDGK